MLVERTKASCCDFKTLISQYSKHSCELRVLSHLSVRVKTRGILLYRHLHISSAGHCFPKAEGSLFLQLPCRDIAVWFPGGWIATQA